jgi:predicted signal transduction protein with EAL and GGDEF domain
VRDDLPRVLCVDDEPNVLAGLRRTLRHTCAVTTALGAAAAMQVIDAEDSFPVVISDFNMPETDGIEFLRWVAEHSPDTTNILLTGNANLSVAIDAVNAGFVFRFLTKPCPPETLRAAIAAAYDRHEARRAERMLASRPIDQDALTGLPDRTRFAADAAHMLEREPGRALSLIVVAIDDLDLVRRTLGHTACDEVMAATARCLQTALRDPRYPLADARLFRIDDRLALLWFEHTTARADLVATHLLKAMAVDVSLGGEKVRLSGRAGVAELGGDAVDSDPATDPLIALRNAEAACLEASAAGGPRITHFSASVQTRERRRLRLLQALRSPQFTAGLTCLFQPQWGLRENRIVGLEALARWHHPELGSIAPAEFVPLAEDDTDLADRLADWMLLAACRQRRQLLCHAASRRQSA